jgi:hypothetical protein
VALPPRLLKGKTEAFGDVHETTLHDTVGHWLSQVLRTSPMSWVSIGVNAGRVSREKGTIDAAIAPSFRLNRRAIFYAQCPAPVFGLYGSALGSRSRPQACARRSSATSDKVL